MRRVLVSVVSVGALVFSVYVASGGTVQEQVDFLADGGLAPNRDAVCPVRLDADFAADAGLKVYQRLKFPVVLTVLPDGGRDVQMPPMPLQKARQAFEVNEWNDCTLSASTGPVAALWGTDKPFTAVGVVKPWCRAKFDAGLPCVLLDGGDFGDRNVGRCSDRSNPSTCERVSGGSIYLGDDPEDL